MCLSCGCGRLSDNHGDPLQLTLGRFKLLSDRNHRSMQQTALIILATLLGVITKTHPLGTDKIMGEPKRVEVLTEKEAKYVGRTREPRKKRKTSVE